MKRIDRLSIIKGVLMGNHVVKHPVSLAAPSVRFLKIVPNSGSDRTVVITGANTGMGLQTAINLAYWNATVILGCRNMYAGQKAVEIVKQKTKNNKITVHKLDLASFASIREFSNLIMKEYHQLDILINNAGVFMLPLKRTSDGIEMHFGVNYLGHYLLTNLLLDKLKESPAARIVNIASNVPPISMINFEDINSEKSYNRVRAVVQSKQAVLLSTKFLSAELEGSSVTVNSVDPGLVLNEFGRNRDYWYGYFQLIFYPLLMLLLKSPAKGCESAVYCAASNDLMGISGKHIRNSNVENIPLPKSLDTAAAANKLHRISRSLVQ